MFSFLVPPIQFWYLVLKIFSPVSLVCFHGSSNPFLVPPLDISSPITLVFLQDSPNLILVSSSWYLQSSYNYLLIPPQSSFLVSIPPSWCSVPFLLGFSNPILLFFPNHPFLELLRHPWFLLYPPTPPHCLYPCPTALHNSASSWIIEKVRSTLLNLLLTLSSTSTLFLCPHPLSLCELLIQNLHIKSTYSYDFRWEDTLSSFGV